MCIPHITVFLKADHPWSLPTHADCREFSAYGFEHRPGAQASSLQPGTPVLSCVSGVGKQGYWETRLRVAVLVCGYIYIYI